MKKALLLIILTPAQSSVKTDDTIRSKSNAGSAYAAGWDAVFGKKDTNPSTTLN